MSLTPYCHRRAAPTLGLLLFALLAPRGASPQPCSSPECVSPLRFTANAGPRYPIEYELTVQNRGARVFDDVKVELWANRRTRGNSPSCEVVNEAWVSTSFPNSHVRWERRVGRLAPGQTRTVSFCLVLRDTSEDACDVAQRFVAQRLPETPDGVREEAYVVWHDLGCEFSEFRCDGNQEGGRCCPAQALHCLFHPAEEVCGGGGAATAALTFLERLVQGAAVTLGRFFTPASDLALLYLLRDDVLAATPGGRQAIALYTAHGAELKRLLLTDASLRERAIDVLTAWRPVLASLVERQGATAVITSRQLAELESFLGELGVVASPGLRSTIEREAQALDLDAFAGLSADQGLQRLNQLTCSPDPTTLCLSAGRFRVDTEWETPDGQRGKGRGVALTADTGYFWFFDAANVETVVKVLDGCAVNGRRWVFGGGLTNVEVVTTVTDTATGASRRYTNPSGRRFQPIQDTGAFADCP